MGGVTLNFLMDYTFHTDCVNIYVTPVGLLVFQIQTGLICWIIDHLEHCGWITEHGDLSQLSKYTQTHAFFLTVILERILTSWEFSLKLECSRTWQLLVLTMCIKFTVIFVKTKLGYEPAVVYNHRQLPCLLLWMLDSTEQLQ